MIDLEREAPITLAEAPKLIPAINAAPGMDARKPLHQRTIYNWATRGKRGVVLESVMIGGVIVTTREAIQRFLQRLSIARETQFAARESEYDPRRRHPIRRRTKQQIEARLKLARDHGI